MNIGKNTPQSPAAFRGPRKNTPKNLANFWVKNRRIKTVIAAVCMLAAAAALWQYVYKNEFMKAAFPAGYAPAVEKYAQQYGIDPNLIFAVIKNESNFDPGAVSSAGALGLMQIKPDTFNWVRSKVGEGGNLSANDLYDPETNIKYGTAFLSLLTGEFKDTGTVIAAYHAGRASVNKWLKNKDYSKDGQTLYYIPFDDTRQYVAKVMETHLIYSSLYGSVK
jgi:soluble lytic murein transglycosylase